MRRFAAILCLGGGLASCAVGPDFVAPVAGPSRHYLSGQDPVATVEADAVAQQFLLSAELPAEWWHLFANPQLDALVREGLAASPTIAAAKANLRAAQHNLQAGQGIFYPQANVGAGASRQRDATGLFNLFTLSASVSYVLDIWGGERRAVEALGAAADYQRNVARAAALTLTASIVNSVIALTAYDAEIIATRAIIALEADQLRLARIQAGSGSLSMAAVLTLQAQLDNSQVTLPALLQRRAQADHLLAVLCGRPPSEGSPPTPSFAELTLPQFMPLSLPAELVRQRPDILQAEASLHEASAQIGVTTAALLPTVNLDGAFGFAGGASGGLITAKNQAWSFGGGLTTPIFHGGSLWFQREAAKDLYDANLAYYHLTVLVAFEQVADILRALEHDAEGLNFAESGLTTASRALALVRANVAAGSSSYSELLIADALFQQAQLVDIAMRAARYQDSVALFAALGGGWWNDRTTTPTQPE